MIACACEHTRRNLGALEPLFQKEKLINEIRNFPARHLEPQLPAHVSRSLRGDGLRPAQGPLLNHRQQKRHLRGDDREPIASERQAAEALFTPKRQPVEPSVSDPAPSAERSKRKPRVLPMLSPAPVGSKEIAAPVNPEPRTAREIPRSQHARIRTWVDYGMTVPQV